MTARRPSARVSLPLPRAAHALVLLLTWPLASGPAAAVPPGAVTWHGRSDGGDACGTVFFDEQGAAAPFLPDEAGLLHGLAVADDDGVALFRITAAAADDPPLEVRWSDGTACPLPVEGRDVDAAAAGWSRLTGCRPLEREEPGDGRDPEPVGLLVERRASVVAWPGGIARPAQLVGLPLDPRDRQAARRGGRRPKPGTEQVFRHEGRQVVLHAEGPEQQVLTVLEPVPRCAALDDVRDEQEALSQSFRPPRGFAVETLFSWREGAVWAVLADGRRGRERTWWVAGLTNLAGRDQVTDTVLVTPGGSFPHALGGAVHDARRRGAAR